MASPVASRFDAAVVGAGTAGAAAALVMARAGLRVALIDRDRSPGAGAPFGELTYRHVVRRIVADGWREASFPAERVIAQHRVCLLAPDSSVTVGHTHRALADPPNAWSVTGGRLASWLVEKACAAGATAMFGWTADGLCWSPARGLSGHVDGVRLSRAASAACGSEGGCRVSAGVVVIAEGSRGELRATLPRPRSRPCPEYVLACARYFLGAAALEERFQLEPGCGALVELAGLAEGAGGAFVTVGSLLTDRDGVTLALGFPAKLLEQWPLADVLDAGAAHAALHPLLRGARRLETAAFPVPDGTWSGLPQLAGAGWLLCGDAAGLATAAAPDGTPLAALSGLLAGEAVVAGHAVGDTGRETLRAYERRLAAEFGAGSPRGAARLPALHRMWSSKRLLDGIVLGANDAALRYFLVDGTPRRDAQRQATRRLLQALSCWAPFPRAGILRRTA
ncbi:MAG TPA: NAD(P)-binding protein [Chloroflexota bacterium]|nr:NAD(P)-binding protein [Chloroflexota bacterium]